MPTKVAILSRYRHPGPSGDGIRLKGILGSLRELGHRPVIIIAILVGLAVSSLAPLLNALNRRFKKLENRNGGY